MWWTEGYAKAFADYGIDVLNLPVEEAAARIRARRSAGDPAGRHAGRLGQSARVARNEADRARIRAVAGAVDPDPWRRQVREAVQKRDGKALAELAGSPEPGATTAEQPRRAETRACGPRACPRSRSRCFGCCSGNTRATSG